jgi:NTE family protein
MQAPDVLVLGAGGALAEAWMRGVLAGIAAETGIDFRTTESLVGTSAGAIVAADLLAGRAPEGPAGLAELAELAVEAEPAAAGEPGAAAARESEAGVGAGEAGGPEAAAGGEEADDGEQPEGEALLGRIGRVVARPLGGAGRVTGRLAKGAGLAAGRPLAPYALWAARPAGELLRAGVLGRIPPPRATLDELGARLERDNLRFDGRLRVVCVERASGRRVVFGAPGSPPASVAQAVQASCTVPWLYRPVRIDEQEYVDGGLWSPTSIDVAPALRETHVLCLNPTASASGDSAPHGAIRLASRSAAALEAVALRRRGAHVTLLGPDRPAAATLGGPAGGLQGHDAATDARAAGYRQGVELAREGADASG